MLKWKGRLAQYERSRVKKGHKNRTQSCLTVAKNLSSLLLEFRVKYETALELLNAEREPTVYITLCHLVIGSIEKAKREKLSVQGGSLPIYLRQNSPYGQNEDEYVFNLLCSFFTGTMLAGKALTEYQQRNAVLLETLFTPLQQEKILAMRGRLMKHFDVS